MSTKVVSDFVYKVFFSTHFQLFLFQFVLVLRKLQYTATHEKFSVLSFMNI